MEILDTAELQLHMAEDHVAWAIKAVEGFQNNSQKDGAGIKVGNHTVDSLKGAANQLRKCRRQIHKAHHPEPEEGDNPSLGNMTL